MATTPEVQEWVLDHKTMVLLGVSDEREMERWMSILEASGTECTAFVEPDMGDQKTAAAVHPSADPRMFRRLRLL